MAAFKTELELVSGLPKTTVSERGPHYTVTLGATLTGGLWSPSRL